MKHINLNWIISGLVSLGMIVLAVSMFWSMPVEAFINLVSEMMTAQGDYWKNRTQSNLIKAKVLEKQVRQALKDGISIPLTPDPSPAGRGEEDQIGLFE